MTRRIDNIVEAPGALVLGAGMAGLFTALKLAPFPALVLAGARPGTSGSSAWAQGGIAAAMDEHDNWQSHAADTIAAGAGTCDPRIVELVTRDAPSRIEDLIAYGAPFDRKPDGTLALGREAAHSAKRIVHVKGDRAGAIALYVHDALGGMCGLAAQRERAVRFAVERRAIGNQILYPRRCIAGHQFYNPGIAGTCARRDSVGRVALPIIVFVHRCCDTALRPGAGTGGAGACAGEHEGRAGRQLQRREQSGHPRAENKRAGSLDNVVDAPRHRLGRYL